MNTDYSDGTNVASSQGELSQMNDAADNLFARIDQLTRRASAIGDRMFGYGPEGAVKNPAQDEPDGYIHRLRNKIMRMDMALDELHAEIDRLSAL